MLGGVVGCAEGGATIEVGDDPAWWACQANLAAPTGGGGGDAVYFEGTSDQSDGLNAERSGGDEECAIYFGGECFG